MAINESFDPKYLHTINTNGSVIENQEPDSGRRLNSTDGGQFVMPFLEQANSTSGSASDLLLSEQIVSTNSNISAKNIDKELPNEDVFTAKKLGIAKPKYEEIEGEIIHGRSSN